MGLSIVQEKKGAVYPNPLGLDGMSFMEYCGPDAAALEKLFLNLGFVKVGHHKSKNIGWYQQNRIHFFLNHTENGFASQFKKSHGPSICATGFRVKNAKLALSEAKSRGARIWEEMEPFTGIYGIGDSLVYFVDEASEANYFSQFERSYQGTPQGLGLDVVDHMTNNVPRGEMQKWCDFYQNIFGFRETRYFDIKGKQTGLVSKVMRSPCNKIIIPINEPSDGKSQIQEYLDEYQGSGIQHVALLTSDICSRVKQLRSNGIAFLETPATYFDLLPKRLPNVTEDIHTLAAYKILADGDPEGYLLQIFTQNMIGPIFFEIIERKNHEGFGEGNFQALFDSIEEDQRRRGYLN